MEIIWSERAFVRRRAIEDYILYSFGYTAYAEFLEKVNEWKQLVMSNPKAGKVEPLLARMRKEYRSYPIGKLSKCVYYIEGDYIVFADWWNTRSGVQKLKRGL